MQGITEKKIEHRVILTQEELILLLDAAIKACHADDGAPDGLWSIVSDLEYLKDQGKEI